MIEIPPNKLPDRVLVALIEEFINREGTDYGEKEINLDSKIKDARSSILKGNIVITFDPKTESCNLITKEAISRLKKN
ncbi:MAG: hypothetical protein CMK44_03330 [Porticoccus sp.]|jgi:uncharacterized protein YheU (UPF0270 family)|nr:hypothetical protein [Porticoccus sp.]|tara:strand:- start:97 stop:330 length:234 start_codon:yes stop_codon:yes gene_type:complete